MKRILLLALLLGGCSNGESQPDSQDDPKKADTEEIEAGDLKFKVPGDWVQETPKNNMRKAQYRVKDKDASEGDGEFVVFKFGHSSVDANLDRWYTGVAGSDREASPPEEIKVGDLVFHTVDLTGAYTGQGGESINDARFLGSIVVIPEGNYFFKLVGPRGTIGDWVDEFRALLQSATYEKE